MNYGTAKNGIRDSLCGMEGVIHKFEPSNSELIFFKSDGKGRC